MPGIVGNIIGLVRDVNEHKKAARIQDAAQNYLTDPDGTASALMSIDAPTGIAYHDKSIADQTAARKAQTDQNAADWVTLGRGLRGIDPKDIPGAVQKLTPWFQAQGIHPDRIAAFTQAATADPEAFKYMDDESWKNASKDMYTTTVVTPGATAMRNGAPVYRSPFAQRTVTTRGGDGAARTDSFDPNTGQWNTNTNPNDTGYAPPGSPPMTAGGVAPAAPLTVEGLRPHFKQQENGGSYEGHNDLGMQGGYQINPKTGPALAKKLGLAWRPDMMEKSDPASQRYQDAIGGAAIQDAIDHSGGNPAAAFSYYYSGSPTAYLNPKGNPKTAKYVADMMERTGMTAPARQDQLPVHGTGTGSPVVPAGGPTMPGKPIKQVRPATPQELAAAGYPAGSAGQVDETGKFVNLRMPSAASQVAQTKYNDAQVKNGWLLYDQADNMEKFATQALNSPGLDTATGTIAGRAPGWMLGQDAQDFQNSVGALKGNVRLDQMLKLKNASPTGATGLGSVSNEEGRALESGYGSLDLTGSPAKVRQTLQNIVATARKIKERQQQGLQRSGHWADRFPDQAATQAAPGALPPPPVGTIVSTRSGYQQYTAQGWKPFTPKRKP
jgi:hypothetical protein